MIILMIALAEKDRRTIEKAYEFADLRSYSWHKRWLICAADLVFFLLISLIGKTLRFEVRGMEHFERIRQAGQLPIQCFWHGSIFPATYYFRHHKLVVMTSQSFDGEYIARFIQRFGYGVVRGSSTRGGVGALVEQIRLMKLGCPAGFAVDGPKGPRHIVKEGALLLAKKTGNPIVPFALTARSFWTIKSWDRMEIPRPFTKILIEVAPPIYVSASANDAEIAAKRVELQNVLDDLIRRGKIQS
ncbi:MAG: lysophospholipid acyltransferase family protein [Pyrinomonadaceae bacterium]